MLGRGEVKFCEVGTPLCKSCGFSPELLSHLRVGVLKKSTPPLRLQTWQNTGKKGRTFINIGVVFIYVLYSLLYKKDAGLIVKHIKA